MRIAFLLEEVLERPVELVTTEALSPHLGSRILIADALGSITEQALLDRYDPAAMRKVYPQGMWSGHDEDKAYLVEYFKVLQEFVLRTRDKRLGLCASLC